MKRTLSLLLALAAVLALSACGAPAGQNGLDSSAEADSPVSSTPETALPEQPDAGFTSPEGGGSEDPAGDEDGGILIAYFSWSGNTEKLANMIQAETGGDLFAIEPVTPYTDSYNDLLDIASQEQSDQARPAVASQVDNWDDYDTIFIGYPNWWSDTPMIVRSFLESYDCTGKRVIPFCTHGSGGFGRSVDSVTESAAGAEVLTGFEIAGSRVDSADISGWIDGLGLGG